MAGWLSIRLALPLYVLLDLVLAINELAILSLIHPQVIVTLVLIHLSLTHALHGSHSVVHVHATFRLVVRDILGIHIILYLVANRLLPRMAWMTLDRGLHLLVLLWNENLASWCMLVLRLSCRCLIVLWLVLLVWRLESSLRYLWVLVCLRYVLFLVLRLEGHVDRGGVHACLMLRRATVAVLLLLRLHVFGFLIDQARLLTKSIVLVLMITHVRLLLVVHVLPCLLFMLFLLKFLHTSSRICWNWLIGVAVLLGLLEVRIISDIVA